MSRNQIAMRPLISALLPLVLLSAPAWAQIQTTPLERAAGPTQAPAAAPQAEEPPPVLPQIPVRRALESAANGGSGGMSYAGPSGAMNTSPNGSSCAVTCTLDPPEQYQVKCKPGYTAMCQCDTAPMAGCRQQ